MKVHIYAEDPNPNYLKGLYLLEKEGKVEVCSINSRVFSSFYGLFKGRTKLKDLIETLTGPLKLLFCKNIIVCTGPYGSKIYYFLFLKLLRKNLVYYNSWPYWTEKKRYINKPILFTRMFWNLFLRKTKVASVTHFGVEEVSKLGAKGFYKPQCIDPGIFYDKGHERKKNVVLFVGRLIEGKGVRGILEVASKLKDLEFWFVGGGPLKEIIKGDNVKYLGTKTQEELVELYNEATMFVLNSYSIKNSKWEEWFGISLIEAMACGLPIISTDCIGPKEIVTDGKNGFLIAQKDEKALLDKIKTLRDDETLREDFRVEGKKRVEEFSVKNLAQIWWKAIEN